MRLDSCLQWKHGIIKKNTIVENSHLNVRQQQTTVAKVIPRTTAKVIWNVYECRRNCCDHSKVEKITSYFAGTDKRVYESISFSSLITVLLRIFALQPFQLRWFDFHQLIRRNNERKCEMMKTVSRYQKFVRENRSCLWRRWAKQKYYVRMPVDSVDCSR